MVSCRVLHEPSRHQPNSIAMQDSDRNAAFVCRKYQQFKSLEDSPGGFIPQASGEAKYTGDMMLDGSELYAYIVKSQRALATITSVDPSAALKVRPGTTFAFLPSTSQLTSQKLAYMTPDIRSASVRCGQL